jgi:hypothetical protein
MPFLNHVTDMNTIGRILIFYFQITDLLSWTVVMFDAKIPMKLLRSFVRGKLALLRFLNGGGGR